MMIQHGPWTLAQVSEDFCQSRLSDRRDSYVFLLCDPKKDIPFRCPIRMSSVSNMVRFYAKQHNVDPKNVRIFMDARLI